MQPRVRSHRVAKTASIALTLLAATSACGDGWRLKGSKTAADVQSSEEPIEPPSGELTQVVRETKPSAAFMLDGAPLCFVGTNQYYLTWKSKKMIDDVFANAKKIGIKVLRHWAFLDRGSLDGSVPHLKDDGTKEGVYFQYWDTETAPARTCRTRT